MDAHPLLPKETVDLLSDNIYAKYSRPSNIIYLSSIFLILAALVLMPFLSVEISVVSSGLLRPAVEISTVKIPSSGKVSRVFVSINQLVHKGQYLVALDSTVIEQRISFLSKEITGHKVLSNDLRLLIAGNHNAGVLTTPFYIQSFHSYSQKKQDLIISYNKAKLNFNRNFKLHQEKVIADLEFEQFEFELEKARNDLELYKQNQLSQWQNEFATHEKQISEYEAQLTQSIKEKQYLIVKAPIGGTIEALSSIHEESQVFANQDIAQISPDTILIVEAYVSPNNIGLLRNSMPVRFQVDAFNYNQWGFATGRIVEISNDIQVVKDKPMFRVQCSIEGDYLCLKNGYKGHLRKGMTLRARFIVTERTLWQLLYDKVDDWINPALYSRMDELN
jgi:multidrug resistance efflux pump